MDHALHVARFAKCLVALIFVLPATILRILGVVHRAIHAAAHLLEPMAKADMPVRFATTKMIEGDPLMPRTSVSASKIIIFSIKSLP